MIVAGPFAKALGCLRRPRSARCQALTKALLVGVLSRAPYPAGSTPILHGNGDAIELPTAL